jgi:hypothetical protein
LLGRRALTRHTRRLGYRDRSSPTPPDANAGNEKSNPSQSSTMSNISELLKDALDNASNERLDESVSSSALVVACGTYASPIVGCNHYDGTKPYQSVFETDALIQHMYTFRYIRYDYES